MQLRRAESARQCQSSAADSDIKENLNSETVKFSMQISDKSVAINWFSFLNHKTRNNAVLQVTAYCCYSESVNVHYHQQNRFIRQSVEFQAVRCKRSLTVKSRVITL